MMKIEVETSGERGIRLKIIKEHAVDEFPLFQMMSLQFGEVIDVTAIVDDTTGVYRPENDVLSITLEFPPKSLHFPRPPTDEQIARRAEIDAKLDDFEKRNLPKS